MNANANRDSQANTVRLVRAPRVSTATVIKPLSNANAIRVSQALIAPNASVLRIAPGTVCATRRLASANAQQTSRAKRATSMQPSVLTIAPEQARALQPDASANRAHRDSTAPSLLVLRIAQDTANARRMAHASATRHSKAKHATSLRAGRATAMAMDSAARASACAHNHSRERTAARLLARTNAAAMESVIPARESAVATMRRLWRPCSPKMALIMNSASRARTAHSNNASRIVA